ncbi:MAG: hypothetical protein IT581_07060 [Verrucomicrobiales bacterium]|nr:hypothetical protein [Verrucomicrobiales bacterium]
MAWAAALSASVSWITFAGAGMALLVLLWAVLRLVNYRLSRHEFEVLVGNLVIRRVYLKDMDGVYVGSRFPTEFWPNLNCVRGGRLTIRRKRGLLRHLTVTPTDPEQLRKNLFYALGWKP